MNKDTCVVCEMPMVQHPWGDELGISCRGFPGSGGGKKVENPVGEMTLLDYFAAHASEQDIVRWQNRGTVTRVQARYLHAKSMMDERGKV